MLYDKTPHEVWIAKKPSLKHLITFVYDAYAHFPNEYRSKLDKNDEKCIFTRYKDDLKFCNI